MKGKIFAIFAVFAMVFVTFGAIGNASAEEVTKDTKTELYPICLGCSISTDKERYVDGEDVVITSRCCCPIIQPYPYPIQHYAELYSNDKVWEITYCCWCSGSIKDSDGNAVDTFKVGGTAVWSADAYNEHLGPGENDFTATVSGCFCRRIYREYYPLVAVSDNQLTTTSTDDQFITSSTTVYEPVTELICCCCYRCSASTSFTIVNIGPPTDNPGADNVPDNQGTAHNPNL